VVSLGEIATLPQTEGDGRYDAMQGVSFLEVLGLADERHDELLSAAKAYLATWHSSGRHPLAGLSPHAPYTVGPRLVSSIAALAAEALAPVAMHLAETREELELLRAGTGPRPTVNSPWRNPRLRCTDVTGMSGRDELCPGDPSSGWVAAAQRPQPEPPGTVD